MLRVRDPFPFVSNHFQQPDKIFSNLLSRNLLCKCASAHASKLKQTTRKLVPRRKEDKVYKVRRLTVSAFVDVIGRAEFVPAEALSNLRVAERAVEAALAVLLAVVAKLLWAAFRQVCKNFNTTSALFLSFSLFRQPSCSRIIYIDASFSLLFFLGTGNREFARNRPWSFLALSIEIAKVLSYARW